MLRKISTKKKGPTGGYSMYFQLTAKKGIKVLKGSFTTFNAALNSDNMREAMKERDIIKTAESSGVSPKCYGVTIIIRGSKYRVGIVMEHLGNKRLADTKMKCKDKKKVISKLVRRLKGHSVKHTDLHAWNVMVKNGKYYAVDFSPDYTEIKE